jgi:hypothetical protein
VCGEAEDCGANQKFSKRDFHKSLIAVGVPAGFCKKSQQQTSTIFVATCLSDGIWRGTPTAGDVPDNIGEQLGQRRLPLNSSAASRSLFPGPG